MDKMISAYFGGKIRYLHYSVEVMFTVNEKYGSVQQLLDELSNDDRKGFDALRFIATKMANDAELCRRAEGYTPEEMLYENDISPLMKPAIYLALKEAVSQSIALGYQQEVDSDENKEQDLGLLELQKKEGAGV